MNVKQVIVIRRDLKMSPGKMASQVAHSSMGALFSSSIYITVQNTEYKSIKMDYYNKTWLDGIFTKICLWVDSEDELLLLADKANKAHLPHFLCQDNGLTEFNNVKTYTTLAIGPYSSDKIDKITGNLSTRF